MNNETQSNPLQSHVLDAQDEVKDAQQNVAAQDAARKKPGFWPAARNIVAVIALIGLVGALAWKQDELRYWIVGPSPQTLRADLEAIMAEAAQDVNNYRIQTGKLPDQLPNPALTMVVNYKRDSDAQYTLSAAIGQIRIEQSY
ncbi:MAG: hypothetical protein LM522_14125 [Candidatus Contendobacter sp.]|nr:hypothetical protein [Candidatus Contendobacter sp.]